MQLVWGERDAGVSRRRRAGLVGGILAFVGRWLTVLEGGAFETSRSYAIAGTLIGVSWVRGILYFVSFVLLGVY